MALAAVQSGANGTESGAASSVVITMPGNLTVGNLVALWVAWGNSALTISGVTGGGTYVDDIAKVNDTMGDGWSLQGLLCKQLTTAPGTITVNLTGNTLIAAAADEFSGQDTGTQPDTASPAVNNQIAPTPGAGTIVANTVTPAHDGAIISAFSACPFHGSFTSLDADTGWTAGALNGANNARSRSSYKLIASAAATIAKFTQNGAATAPDFMTAVMVIRAAAGGGGAVKRNNLMLLGAGR